MTDYSAVVVMTIKRDTAHAVAKEFAAANWHYVAVQGLMVIASIEGHATKREDCGRLEYEDAEEILARFSEDVTITGAFFINDHTDFFTEIDVGDAGALEAMGAENPTA